MNDTEFSLDLLSISNLINVIRSTNNRDRLLDAMYYGQLASKSWIVNTINPLINKKASIYIFGGWVGILAKFLFKSTIPISKIYNIDIDDWAVDVSKKINTENNYFVLNADMIEFEYPTTDNDVVVVNTITEHLTQEQYTQWYQKVPVGSLVVVQGNNLFKFDDHVRCSHNLEEFLLQNNVSDSLYNGELEFSNYKRFMSIWRKY